MANKGTARRVPPASAPRRELRRYFVRNGYVRVADLERRKELSSKRYKKGYEVRIIVMGQEELTRVRELVKQAGFRPGRPFRKALRWAQPVYGKAAVEWFQRRRRERTGR